MGIKIVLKEILSETEGVVEYGASRDFIIGAPGTAGRGSSDYEIVVWDYEQIEDATDVASWNLADGVYFYQAFKENGTDELGFRIKYRRSVSERFHQLVIYNEEAGLYVAGDTWGPTSNRRDRLIIALNGYWGTTLEGALRAMKTQWEIKAPCYTVGLNTHKYALLSVLAGRNETSQYYSQYSGRLMMSLYGRMRYASSWTKLITGEFENVDNLFSAAVTDGSAGGVEKKKTFYFGKVLEKAEEIPITSSIRSSYPSSISEDPAEGYADVEFGTDISWYIKNYNDAPIVFENGMTISLERENGFCYAVLRAPVEEDGTIVTYTLKQRYPSTIRIDDYYVVSGIRAFIDYNPLSIGEEPYLGAAPFISPYYNEVASEDLVSFINGIDEPSDPAKWTQLPLRFITFAQTSNGWATAEQRNNFYGFNSEGDIAYTWSGTANVSNTANNDNTRFVTIYREDGGSQFCDFTRQGWVAVAKYEKPKEPPKTGGGSLGGNRGRGGGKGSFNDDGENIGIPENNFGYSGSSALRIWYIGDQSTHSGDLSKISDWISNPDILQWLSSVTYSDKLSAIVDLKVVATPRAIPGTDTQYWKIHCMGTPVRSNLADDTLEGLGIKQYDVYEMGNFDVPEYFGNFLDYQSEYKICLPYSGTYELSPSDVVGNHCVLKCAVDYMTGNLTYALFVDDGNTNSVRYTFTGNSTVAQLPLTSVDEGAKSMRMVQVGAQAAMTMAGSTAGDMASFTAALSENPPTPAQTMQGAVSDASNIKSSLMSSLNNAGSFCGFKGSSFGSYGSHMPQVPYLIITRPKMSLPENFGSIYGWSSNLGGKIGSFTGMSVVKEVHLDNISALSTEIDEIEAILKTGVIL